jgi:hypothetical protein
MTTDKKININENQVIFKRDNGHKHDGLTSSLIDYTRYSIFDFPVYPVAPVGTPRRNFEDTNVKNLESFIISTIENRVLNPRGIAIQANTITAREIASGTITSGELASNIILVNNVIKSKNYNGTINSDGAITAQGNAGWAITHAGSAEFSSASIRGAIIANSVSTPGIDILSDGSISSTNFNVTATGNVTAVNADITGTITSNSGTIGGWSIDSSGLFKTINIAGTNYTARLGTDATLNLHGVYDDEYATSYVHPGRIYAYASESATTITGSRIDTSQIFVNNGAYSTTLSANSTNADAITTNGGVKVGNGFNIKATTSFRTTGSSTTARVTQGDEAGFDNLCRPSSLRELKENIEDIQDALSILSDLRPRTYNFKVDAFYPVDPNTQQPWTEEARAFAQLDLKYGFIVEEVFDTRPELVSYSHEYTTDDPYGEGGYFDFSSWKPTMWEDIDVLVLCVKAIQELSDKVNSLQTRVQTLEGV